MKILHNVMMIVHYVMTILPLCYNGLRGEGAEKNKVAKFWKITDIHASY